MKRKKIADKVMLGMITVMVFGIFGTMSTRASNWEDQPYIKEYNGDGGDVFTDWYTKTDDTSVYIKHQGDVNVWVRIRVAGSSNNFVWGGGVIKPPLGQGYKISNNVWETYRRPVNVRLQLTPETHSPCMIHGLWSVDSI